MTRLATLADRGRPGMERSTRLRHSSADRLIILFCDADFCSPGLFDVDNTCDIFTARCTLVQSAVLR